MNRNWHILLIISFLIFIWYLFIKPYDYIIKFKINASPGIIFEEIKSFYKTDDSKILGEEKYKFLQIVSTTPYKSQILINIYFKPVNDTLTKIKIGFSDTENNFSRLNVLFNSSKIKTHAVKKSREIRDQITSLLSGTSVSFVGETISPSFDVCACIRHISKRVDKAKEMIRSNNIILIYLESKNIDLKHYPFTEILDWNTKIDVISFDFCFPIKAKIDSLPKTTNKGGIFFKKLDAQKTLKVVFVGNYRASDRAWFYIENYSNLKKQPLKNINPIEFYHNNPHEDYNDKTWKTDIYFPLRN